MVVSTVLYILERERRCTGNGVYALLGVYNYAGMLLVVATYLMWRMRNARKQVSVLAESLREVQRCLGLHAQSAF